LLFLSLSFTKPVVLFCCRCWKTCVASSHGRRVDSRVYLPTKTAWKLEPRNVHAVESDIAVKIVKTWIGNIVTRIIVKWRTFGEPKSYMTFIRNGWRIIKLGKHPTIDISASLVYKDQFPESTMTETSAYTPAYRTLCREISSGRILTVLEDHEIGSNCRILRSGKAYLVNRNKCPVGSLIAWRTTVETCCRSDSERGYWAGTTQPKYTSRQPQEQSRNDRTRDEICAEPWIAA